MWVHSSGWWAMPGGSHPARSHPAAAAMSGRPTRMMRRFSAGTLANAERPPKELDQSSEPAVEWFRAHLQA